MVISKRRAVTIRERILKLLDRNGNKAFSARRISDRTKANYNSVRRELGQLILDGWVEFDVVRGRKHYSKNPYSFGLNSHLY